jgi:ubiquitin C-terminal hydrolase
MLTGSELKTCNNCTTSVRGNTINEAGICLQVTRATPNFNYALTDFFHNARRLRCVTCASNQSHIVATQIVSGPQILKISRNMFSWNEKSKRLAKVHHTLQHLDILDLTQFQLHSSLPLRYKFSSVVSHNGSGMDGGHYMASVRGQGEQT